VLDSVAYPGALPENSDVVTLYDSSLYPPSSSQRGVRRISWSAYHDAAGTMTAEFSIDGGENWSLAYTSGNWSLAYTSGSLGGLDSTDLAHQGDWMVEGMPDIRLRWTNGGTTQTAFKTTIALSQSRAPRGDIISDYNRILLSAPDVLLLPSAYTAGSWPNTLGALGNGWTQGTGAAQPTLDSSTYSNAVLTFDGGDYLTYSGTASDFDDLATAAISWNNFVAVRPSAVAATDFIWSVRTTGQASGTFLRLATGTPGAGIPDTTTGSYYFITRAAVLANTNLGFHVYHTLGTGLSINDNAGTVATDTTASGSPASGVSVGLQIGSRGDGGAFQMDGAMGIYIMYLRAISAGLAQACNTVASNWFTTAY